MTLLKAFTNYFTKHHSSKCMIKFWFLIIFFTISKRISILVFTQGNYKNLPLQLTTKVLINFGIFSISREWLAGRIEQDKAKIQYKRIRIRTKIILNFTHTVLDCEKTRRPISMLRHLSVADMLQSGLRRNDIICV